MVAPLVPFTADEAWSYAANNSDFSQQLIALSDWPVADPKWENAEVAADIRALRSFLSEKLNDPLESLRQQKVIGQSLDAKAIITGCSNDPEFARLKKYQADLPELFILSQVTVAESEVGSALRIEVAHADGIRCPRSWRWVTALVETEQWGPVSPRCKEALEQISSSL